MFCSCFRAVHVLSQIKEMRSGAMVEKRIISIADQVCLALSISHKTSERSLLDEICKQEIMNR